LAHWFDDLLTARLSLRQFWEARQRGDAKAMMDAYKGGLLQVPAGLMPLHHVLPQSADEVTFEHGLRMVLLSSFSAPDRKRIQRADLLPFTRFSSLGGSDRANFDATLSRTAVLAVAEGANYQTSTYGRLRDKQLRALPPFASIATELPSLTAAQQAVWMKMLEPYQAGINVIPSDGDPIGFFTIAPDTGSMLAILPDGTGGGFFSRDPGDWAGAVINIAAVIGDIGGFGFAFGAWCIFAKTLVQLILAATVQIAKMEGGAPPFSPNGTLCGLACDLAKNTALAALGLGAVSNLDNLVEAATGQGIPCGC